VQVGAAKLYKEAVRTSATSAADSRECPRDIKQVQQLLLVFVPQI